MAERLHEKLGMMIVYKDEWEIDNVNLSPEAYDIPSPRQKRKFRKDSMVTVA
jgi:hypothetical protein